MKALTLSSTLPTVNGNFEEVKAELQNHLNQFDLIVDEESVKTAKSMATQINKLSKEIEDLRKKEIKKLSVPLEEFEVKMKELEALCQSSRQNLLSQVKVYDNKRLSLVQELLEKELQSKYKHYGINQEFQTLKVHNLIMLSSLTKGGALTKKAKDAIDEKVTKQKRFQEKIETRLLTLETICFKGGLNTPLTRENINHFLFIESDNEYLVRLTSLIQNEINRLQESEARRVRVTQDAKASESTQKPPYPTPQPQKPQHQESSVMKRFKNARVFSKQKKTFKVTATFEIEFESEDGIEEKLAAMLVHKFRTSGFKQMPTVKVVETSS